MTLMHWDNLVESWSSWVPVCCFQSCHMSVLNLKSMESMATATNGCMHATKSSFSLKVSRLCVWVTWDLECISHLDWYIYIYFRYFSLALPVHLTVKGSRYFFYINNKTGSGGWTLACVRLWSSELLSQQAARLSAWSSFAYKVYCRSNKHEILHLIYTFIFFPALECFFFLVSTEPAA